MFSFVKLNWSKKTIRLKEKLIEETKEKKRHFIANIFNFCLFWKNIKKSRKWILFFFFPSIPSSLLLCKFVRRVYEDAKNENRKLHHQKYLLWSYNHYHLQILKHSLDSNNFKIEFQFQIFNVNFFWKQKNKRKKKKEPQGKFCMRICNII